MRYAHWRMPVLVYLVYFAYFVYLVYLVDLVPLFRYVSLDRGGAFVELAKNETDQRDEIDDIN